MTRKFPGTALSRVAVTEGPESGTAARLRAWQGRYHAGSPDTAAPVPRPQIQERPVTDRPARLYLLLMLSASAGLCACGGGGGGGAAQPQPSPPSTVTISGRVQYEFVPPQANCQGLDFNGVELRPVRQATIEVVDGTSNAVLDTGITDDDGLYAVSVDAGSDVFLRVRAELKRTGAPAWNVEVRDNFDDSLPANQRPSLPQRPMYVLDGSVFDAGTVNSNRNLTATTGWNASTSSYDGPRAAAPFAILDAIYAGMRLVLAEAPQVVFEPLDVFWSIHNTPTDADSDIDLGELPTSFYSSDNRLFLLGMDGVDTEEFDDHVIAHEWGHYFEDALSRSDSIGGAHSLGERLDMRVAFGEGWATALSGMALDDAQYCDTLGAGNASGFRIGIESPGNIGPRGWYNELSVMEIIYDLWDEDIDGVADTASMGFGPLYDVMIAAQSTTPAFTSIFSFASALKAENPGDATFIDGLLMAQSITAAGIDAYGSNESNNAGNADDVLPVYTVIPDGSSFEICSNSQFDRSGGNLVADGNKLSEHRYLRMTLAAPARLSVDIRTTDETVAMLPPDDPDDPVDQSDPDILIYRAGEMQNRFVDGDLQGLSGDANAEVFTTPDPLPAGDYVMALNEFRYEDTGTAPDFPARSCFDVTVTAVP